MFIRGLPDNILATMNNPHIKQHFDNHRNHRNVLRSWLRNLKVSYVSRHLIVWVQGDVDQGILDGISTTIVNKPYIKLILSIIVVQKNVLKNAWLG